MQEYKLPLVKKAEKFAKAKHYGMKDDTGRDYFEAHLKQVVSIVSQVTDDEEILAAAYLHDTLEDTNTSIFELQETFGDRVATLVLELTKQGNKDSKGYYFPLLERRDAILIKFADRLSNLSRMEAWGKKRQDQYLRKSRFWNLEPGK